jgi:hypothetical protein
MSTFLDPFVKFNTQALEFLSKMVVTFPNETKLRQYKLQFETLQKINSRKPVELFMYYIEDDGLHIMTKNEQFFKQDNYVNSAESFSGSLGLVEIWDSIPEDTKNSMWAYMQTLYVLGMKALKKDEKLKQILQQINK